MASTLTITLDDDAARRALDAVGALAARPRRLLFPIGVAMQREVATIFREQTDPETGARWKAPGAGTLALRPGGGSNGQALLDTGRLRNALVSGSPKMTIDSVSIDTGGVVYARLHNEGGMIKPRAAKFLAIPLTRDAKRAGSARRWMEKNKAQKPFFFTSKKGNRLIAIKGKDGEPVPQFVLKSSSTIPRRRFLGISPRLRQTVAGIAKDVVEVVIAEATRGGGQ